MKKIMVGAVLAFTLGALGVVASADDAAVCLECHVPAEDWEGMSPAEVMKFAMDQEIKMHEDHRALDEEQLKKIIATMLPDSE